LYVIDGNVDGKGGAAAGHTRAGDAQGSKPLLPFMASWGIMTVRRQSRRHGHVVEVVA